MDDVDDRSKEIAGPCLRTSLILRKILQEFSSAELVQLSLVNKLWNYEARSVLRDEGKLSAKMKKGRSVCHNLRAFASDLRKISVIPFTGISIDQGNPCSANDHKGGWNICSNMEPIYEDILDRIQWKNLAVRLLVNWEKHKKCKGLVLVKQILDNFCEDLEEFSVLVQSKQGESIQEFLQGFRFPRLKILKIQNTNYLTSEDYTSLIKTLVSRAPNLQVLDTGGSSVNLDANLLEGSSAVHVTDIGFSLHEIPTSVVGRLKVKHLELRSPKVDLNLERFTMAMSIAFQTSRTTLRSLDIDAVFLVTLMRWGICLENVQVLKILFDSLHLERFQSRMLRIVKFFDISRVFPRLTQVQSFRYFPRPGFSVEEINEVLEECNPRLNELDTRNRAANIKTLSLLASEGTTFADIISDFTLRLLSQMLPNIENIVVGPFEGMYTVYSVIWQKYWLTLRELTVKTFGRSSARKSFNFDRAFCGIFSEEVAYLLLKDEEYLRSVNIVPVMPSITCLKGLKSFKFMYTEKYFSGGTNDPTYMFSKVTGLIAFQRCPHLDVTLEVADMRRSRALSHMKPYAHIVLQTSNTDYKGRHGRIR